MNRGELRNRTLVNNLTSILLSYNALMNLLQVLAFPLKKMMKIHALVLARQAIEENGFQWLLMAQNARLLVLFLQIKNLNDTFFDKTSIDEKSQVKVRK